MSVNTHFGKRVQHRYARLQPRHRHFTKWPSLCGGFGESEFRWHARRSNDALIPAMLQLSVRVPACSRDADGLVDRLLREVGTVAPLFDRDRQVERLQLAGMPDCLGARPQARLLNGIARQFNVAGPLAPEHRVSLDACAAGAARIAACRAAGAAGVCVELTYGLRPCAMDTFESTLTAVVNARPDRIELVDDALVLRAGRAAAPLDAATRLGMLARAVACLSAAEYRHAGTGRFELPGRSAPAGASERIGIGPGAASCFGDAVIRNVANVRRWRAAVDAQSLPAAEGVRLGIADRVRADILTHLLGNGRVDIAAVERRFDVSFDALLHGVADRLRQLEPDELVRVEGSRVAATSQGRHLWRILAASFDPGHRSSPRTVYRTERHVEESQRGEAAQ